MYLSSWPRRLFFFACKAHPFTCVSQFRMSYKMLSVSVVLQASFR